MYKSNLRKSEFCIPLPGIFCQCTCFHLFPCSAKAFKSSGPLRWCKTSSCHNKDMSRAAGRAICMMEALIPALPSSRIFKRGLQTRSSS